LLKKRWGTLLKNLEVIFAKYLEVQIEKQQAAGLKFGKEI
jgi:hypothetical protein